MSSEDKRQYKGYAARHLFPGNISPLRKSLDKQLGELKKNTTTFRFEVEVAREDRDAEFNATWNGSRDGSWLKRSQM